METFVTLIPQRAGDTDKNGVSGVVEYVGSGQRQPFASTRELLAFLRADYRGVPGKVER